MNASAPTLTASPSPALGVALAPARAGEASAIEALIRQAKGDCVGQTREQIRARLPEFLVARARERVVGSAAVRVLGPQRAELRGLVVDPDWRKAGLGSLLVRSALERARELGRDLFCVSRSPAFFEALGFVRLPRSEVPWRPGAPSASRPRVALLAPLTSSSPHLLSFPRRPL